MWTAMFIYAARFYAVEFATDMSKDAPMFYVCLLAYKNFRNANHIFTKIDILEY